MKSGGGNGHFAGVPGERGGRRAAEIRGSEHQNPFGSVATGLVSRRVFTSGNLSPFISLAAPRVLVSTLHVFSQDLTLDTSCSERRRKKKRGNRSWTRNRLPLPVMSRIALGFWEEARRREAI